MVPTLEALQGVFEKTGDSLQNYIEKFQMASAKAADSIGSFVNSGLGMIPGGSFVGELLGVDKLQERLRVAGEQGIESVVHAMRTKGVSGVMALTQSASMFGKTLLTALGPIGLIAAAVGGLVALTMNYRKKIDELSASWGLSWDSTAAIHEEMLDIVSSTEGVLGGMEQVQGVMKAMIDQSGNFKVNPIPTESFRAIASFASKFGIAAEDMGKLNVMLQQAGASGKMAANIQTTAAAMADAAGISPSLVTKDMIENAELLSSVYYGMPEAFALATAETRKMGLSIGQAKKMADGLLDIESSLTAQFEASAALGRNSDLSRARDLALQGDYLGMVEEVTSNLATQEEFANMNRYERELMAKAAQMTTEELANMYHYQDLSSKLSKEDQERYSKHKDTLGDITALNEQELATELAKRDSIDQMGATWESIKATLAKALLPLAETFTGILEGLVPVLQLAGHLLKGLGQALNILLFPVKLLADLFVGISVKVREFAESLGVGGDLAGNIGSLATMAAAVGASFLVGFKPVIKLVGWLGGQMKNLGNLFRGMLGKEQKELKLLDANESGISGRERRRREALNAGRSKAMGKSIKRQVASEVAASTANCGCGTGIGGMTDSYGGNSKKGQAAGRTKNTKRGMNVKGRMLRMKGGKLGRGLVGKLGGIASLGIGAMGMFGGGTAAPSDSGVVGSIGDAANTVDAASDVASVGKSVGGSVGKKAAKSAGKSAMAKGLGKAGAKIAGKGVLKALVKKIPIVGAVAGGAFAIQRLMKGDFLGAGLEMLSGVSSIVPGVGTALSVGLDAALAAKDIAKANKESKTASEQINDSSEEISNKVTTATDAYISPLADIGTPEEMDKALSTLTAGGSITGMSSEELGNEIRNADDIDILERSLGVTRGTPTDTGVTLPSDGALEREYQNDVIVRENNKTQVITQSDPEMKRKYDEMIAAIKEASNKQAQVNIGDNEVRRINGIIIQQNGV